MPAGTSCWSPGQESPLQAPEGLGLIPGQGIRLHKLQLTVCMPQLRSGAAKEINTVATIRALCGMDKRNGRAGERPKSEPKQRMMDFRLNGSES